MPASERLLARDLSTALSGIVLFVAGGKSWTVDDALAAAVFRNELHDAIRETLELAGAEELAEERGHEPDSEDLQAFSDRYRYARDLITAGETEEWIRARGLTTDEFGAWIAARVCRTELPDAPPAGELEDLNRRLAVHLWMSDRMDALDDALQRRVASALEIEQSKELIDITRAREAFFARHQLDISGIAEWLENTQRAQAWLDEMLRLEAAYEAIRSKALTAEARQRHLHALGTALERVAIRTLDLDSEAAAKEAVLCVREDGTTLEKVAEESGYISEETEVWLEGVEPGLAQRLFCAEVGEALAPVSVDDGFRVYQLIRKLDPSLSDPAVVERIDRVVLDETFADLCSRHIQPSNAIRVVR